MHTERLIRSAISIIIISGIFISIFFIGRQTGITDTLKTYALANTAYEMREYFEALKLFQEALIEDTNLQNSDKLLSFKIGYALLKTNQPEKALIAFKKSQTDLKIVEDYPIYFQNICYLQMGDTAKSLELQKTLLENFPKSPLAELVDSIQAVSIFQKSQNSDLEKLLKKMLNGRFNKTDIYLKLLELYKREDKSTEFKVTAVTFIKKYPFHDRAESLFTEIRNSYLDKIPTADFNSLIEYLFTKSQFLAANELINFQARFQHSLSEMEYLNWLKIEMLYRQGKYSQVLDWCLKNRIKIKSIRILREIDLHTARCYLQLGLIKKSITTYLNFQKNYPDDTLSPEVLWKVAWLYEGMKDLPRAIQVYKNLTNIYKNNEFETEALFRIGLDYYRLDDFISARKSWENALNQMNRQISRARIQYWIAKSYERQREYFKQGEILLQLAARPTDSFYNMKAFYLTINGGNIHQKINEILWQMHHQDYTYLPDHISNYQRSFIVKEILGKQWADFEIQKINTNIDNWPEVYAQGELHERMENYGTAYRKFRSIFNNHFAEANITEMIPVFKKLYPFYFKSIVDTVAKQFSLPEALILSVIKKESAFEPVIVSYANAFGLMQLLPSTASQLAPILKLNYKSIKQLYDSEFNITVGSYFLSTLLKRYQGNLIMALGAYNAGPNRMDRWRRIYPTNDEDLFMENLEFEQTRVYVRTCLKYYWIYQALIDPENIPDEILTYPVNISDFL